MIVMIGDSSVGKTCLLKKFSEDDFEVDIKSHVATIGVDFVSKVISVFDQLVKLQVWDTAGQERFRAITSSYYRGAMAAIVCYDCTDEMTFKSAEQWIKEFQHLARPNAPVLLVANKWDLYNGAETSVSLERGESLAESYGCKFL